VTEIRLTHHEGKTELTIMGHCNAGRINGFDLCCCAVSMLTHTLLKSLRDINLKDFEGRYGGGWCYIRFSDTSKKKQKAYIIIETIMKGFSMLEESYPANVKIFKQ